MTASNVDLIQQARAAFDAGNVQRGAALIHRVLKQDINNLAAWELLHNSIGKGESFDTFRKAFAQKYYPGTVHRMITLSPREDSKRDEPYRRVSLVTPPRPEEEQDPPGLLDLPRPKSGPLPRPRRISTPQAEVTGSEKQAKEEPPAKRRGLLARIFGVFRRKKRRPAKSAQKKEGRARKERPAEPLLGTEKEGDGISLIDLAQPEPAVKTPAAPEPRQELPRQQAAKPSAQAAPILSGLSGKNEIRVIIADDIQNTRENIRKLLQFESSVNVLALASNGDEAVDLALEHEPDIVLMDINMPGLDGLEALKIIRERLPGTQVIMLTVQDDPGYLREALQFGARDYLIKPPMIDDLLQTIHNTYQIGKAERERLMKMAAPEEPDPLSMDPEDLGFAVAVYSPKGGVGCTMLASNLAVALQSGKKSVVLVDCDLQFGGIGLFFNEQGRNSIADLAPRARELDRKMLLDATVLHAPSDVRLILAPTRPEQAERVRAEQLTELIQVLRALFNYVVVDAASNLDLQTAAVLETCDQVLMVTTQDIPAINDIKHMLNFAPQIGLPVEKISLVLNQYHPRSNITAEQISSNLKHPFAAIVPLESRTVIPSVNRGMPFMLQAEARGQPIGTAIEALAAHIRESQLVFL